jgi:hypothetical protein
MAKQTENKTKSEYYYDRTNSKGEVILKRNTNEDVEYVTAYLTSIDIEYEVKSGARMMWIYIPHKDNPEWTPKKYAYYYTTGRWNRFKRGSYPNKHYRSNGIEDFITRFAMKEVVS